jgi:D-3-phosphoglycerate dehydrogenase / 2-oxoglutarate reductase
MPESFHVVQVGIYAHRVAEMLAWTRAAVEAAGLRYTYVATLQDPAAGRALGTADAVIAVTHDEWTADLFASMPRCRIFVSPGVGLDLIDLDAASRLGIAVVNQPECCSDEVADHTFALILACVRKVVWIGDRVRAGMWDRVLFEPMHRLRGRRLGIVGFGRVGRGVAQRAAGFGLRTVAYDPYVDQSFADDLAVELVALDRLMAESDIIANTAPLTGETRRLLGERQFGLVRPGTIFTNTSRGTIVDEAALLAALHDGRIAAAGLDVLTVEPPAPANPLVSHPRVIVTPHAAGYSDEVVHDLQRLAVEEIVNVLRGGRPTDLGWANRSMLVDGGRIGRFGLPEDAFKPG